MTSLVLKEVNWRKARREESYGKESKQGFSARLMTSPMGLIFTPDLESIIVSIQEISAEARKKIESQPNIRFGTDKEVHF